MEIVPASSLSSSLGVWSDLGLVSSADVTVIPPSTLPTDLTISLSQMPRLNPGSWTCKPADRLTSVTTLTTNLTANQERGESYSAFYSLSTAVGFVVGRFMVSAHAAG